jgi:hypothetical protein
MKVTTGNCLQFKILDSYNFNIFVMNIILINESSWEGQKAVVYWNILLPTGHTTLFQRWNLVEKRSRRRQPNINVALTLLYERWFNSSKQTSNQRSFMVGYTPSTCEVFSTLFQHQKSNVNLHFQSFFNVYPTSGWSFPTLIQRWINVILPAELDFLLDL